MEKNVLRTKQLLQEEEFLQEGHQIVPKLIPITFYPLQQAILQKNINYLTTLRTIQQKRTMLLINKINKIYQKLLKKKSTNNPNVKIGNQVCYYCEYKIIMVEALFTIF